MARSINEIFDSIKQAYVINRAAAGLPEDNPEQWSRVNIKRLMCYIIAFTAYTLELLFDRKQAEIAEDLANLQPPTVGWYANKCLAYQHGFPLVVGTDRFDNSGYTDQQIEASKVIKYAAVQRQVDENGYVVFLRIKLCGENGNELAQLPDEVLAGFNVYLDSFLPAGDNVNVISRPADKLKMTWRIFYNPLILKADGSRQDGSLLTPVRDAILDYLKNGLAFNGQYSITSHIDAVQKVAGVVTPRVLSCSASYDTFPEESIFEYYQAFGGWLRFDDIDNDLLIEYIPA